MPLHEPIHNEQLAGLHPRACRIAVGKKWNRIVGHHLQQSMKRLLADDN